MKATIDQVARRALELVRERHNFRFAVMHAVFEFGGEEDDFQKVLPVLRDLLKRESALRFVYRKVVRFLDRLHEKSEEFQTCLHPIIHVID